MPVSADQERQLLNHYKLTNLYPDTWPHPQDDNASDSDDDEDPLAPSNGLPVRQANKKTASMSSRTSFSKYRNIDRHASIRSAGSMGPESVVQRDEPDPLGMTPSVAGELRRRGIPVEEDLKLRNRFMLSSTSFSPALFLSQVHQDASTDDLLRGLDFLSRSIEQKSASLKVLVESNFDKFVRAKATIDNVYTEMRTQGEDGDTVSSHVSAVGTAGGLTGRRGAHSRHTSRNSTTAHFRNTSGATTPFSPTFGKSVANDRKKNALIKESEYGVLGIKVPLQDVAVKAEEVWGPALGGREKEDTVKSVLTAMEQHRGIFSLSGMVLEAVTKHDYDTVLLAWESAQRYATIARNMADTARQQDTALTDQEAQQILVTAKMYHDVFQQVETLKRDLWLRLKTSHARKPAAVADETDKEEHMELIAVLLQLGVDENPIWEWLNSRTLYLKDRMARSFERVRIEIEIARRRLAHLQTNVDPKLTVKHLRSAVATKGRDSEMDTPPVLAFWEHVHAALSSLLSSPDGLLGEVVEHWETTQSFIDNKAQKSFPATVFASGAEHLELEPDDVANLRAGATDLIAQLRDSTLSFFADPPVEDLSELYSPVPPTPITPASANGSGSNSNALTPSNGTPIKRAFTFDANNVPPPSPSRGEFWEKFAFWAPQSDSLSASHHLSRLILLVATALTEISTLTLTRTSRPLQDSLKTTLASIRERFISALCSAWVADAERSKYLEAWERQGKDRRDLTTFPQIFMAWEEKVLVSGFQKVSFVSEVASGGVVTPPPQKLIQGVKAAFVTGMYKVLSGMVENGERRESSDLAGEEADPDGVALVKASMSSDSGEGGIVDSTNRNNRLLLTLSNLSHLRTHTIPHLLALFETTFSLQIPDDKQKLLDVLSQIDARLFQAYTKPTVDRIASLINAGITSPTWAVAQRAVGAEKKPADASQYVYDILLLFVLTHSEITTALPSPSSPNPLLTTTLSYILEQTSSALLTTFRSARTSYPLSALMQATLDVEFLAQTLNTFTTDRAGELQSQIYLALDERTDDEARKRLQGELPEMRASLKRLREGTRGEFGCFRRERRGRGK